MLELSYKNSLTKIQYLCMVCLRRLRCIQISKHLKRLVHSTHNTLEYIYVIKKMTSSPEKTIEILVNKVSIVFIDFDNYLFKVICCIVTL